MIASLLELKDSGLIVLRDKLGNYLSSPHIPNLEAYILASENYSQNKVKTFFSNYAECSNLENIAIPTLNIPIWGTGLNFRSHTTTQEINTYQLKLIKESRPLLFYKGHMSEANFVENEINACFADDVAIETEIAVLINSKKKIIAYTLSYDVTRYNLELINPLYFDQAKIFDKSFLLGPYWNLIDGVQLENLEISMSMYLNNGLISNNYYKLIDFRRNLEEIIKVLFELRKFPKGVVLMLGSDGCIKLNIKRSDNYYVSAIDNQGLVLNAKLV
jgi:2-keto-4-pentenoate hydratase/2-oxohepta-3-ene-1,7-dioic acid hydratase in catechol pathway